MHTPLSGKFAVPAPHQREAERAAKLGTLGEPAGDAQAVVDLQIAEDKKSARRRARLADEVKEATGQSDFDLQDDLVEKATGKTVDNLVT